MAEISSVTATEDLEGSVKRSLELRRPLLHHLNADTSWLLQLPRPAAESPGGEDNAARRWFNVLFDPWLSGSQSDVASWFSQQWHAAQPAVPSVAKLEELIQHTESITGPGPDASTVSNGQPEAPGIDLVVISHEFTDHCHKETLLQIDPRVPVLASTKAHALVKKWNHFTSVHEIPAFSGPGQDWRENRLSTLPDWLSVSRIVNNSDALYYHSAIMVTFDLFAGAEASSTEAVIYTPHGIDAPSLQAVADAAPPIRTLAFLHGLHAVSLSKQQLNLGAHNGLKAQRILKAPYWIGTHDEIKVGRGLVGWFLNRQQFTLEDALEEEKARMTALGGADDLPKEASFLELSNGAAAVLA